MIGLEQFVFSVTEELLRSRQIRNESLLAGVDFNTYNRLIGEINSIDFMLDLLQDKKKNFLKEEDDADPDSQIGNQHALVYRGQRSRSRTG